MAVLRSGNGPAELIRRANPPAQPAPGAGPRVAGVSPAPAIDRFRRSHRRFSPISPMLSRCGSPSTPHASRARPRCARCGATTADARSSVPPRQATITRSRFIPLPARKRSWRRPNRLASPSRESAGWRRARGSRCATPRDARFAVARAGFSSYLASNLRGSARHAPDVPVLLLLLALAVQPAAPPP